ncbi:MAG TPA: SUMF1/EgtB/PvdO family nonheme iron enzyme [bacterium]|nr:SUMF1/EgtB/PvdO family nonheme iron enzyme [bacterium]
MKKTVLSWTVTVLSFFIFSGCELEKFERPVVDEDSSDADIYEDLLIDMVEVPAGEFLMGCDMKIERVCDTDTPVKIVSLSSFYIDKYEVTVEEYMECVHEYGCSRPSFDNGYCALYIDTYDWEYGVLPDEFREKNKPVVCVSWDQADDYCRWAGKRLPTETEWEKAARGTDGRIYPWGNEDISCEYAVVTLFNSKTEKYEYGCGTHGTWDVGSIDAGISPYGAYDLAGNVYEWVADWYDSEYYQNAPEEDPAGPETGDYKVIRGAGWGGDGSDYDLSSSKRKWGSSFNPGDNVLGFRCAISGK